MGKRYLAIDIGASSGRAMLAQLEKGKLVMEEIHRFPNHPQMDDRGMLYWDVDALFAEIVAAARKAGAIGKKPDYIGIDTWGVDYVLLGDDGKRLGRCHCYRDPKRDFSKQVHEAVDFATLYERTGIQFQPFNTIYQLRADQEDQKLNRASALLLLPDYLNYRLTGAIKQEYCNATTTGLVNASTHDWDYELIDQLGFPRKLFLPLSEPGTLVGPLSDHMTKLIGYEAKVVLPATHDTASAVLAIPLEKDEPYISSGTWSLLGIETEAANCDPLSQKLNYSNEGAYGHLFRYQKNIMGLWMIQEVRHELGDAYSFPELVELAKASTVNDLVDCEDAEFLSPASMIGEINAKVGKNLEVGDLAKVIYASLAKNYQKALAELETLTKKRFPCLHITGGGGKNEYLNELTAKAIGRKIIVGPIEGTAIGNVLMQMLYAQEISSLEEGRQIVKKSFEIKEIQP